MIRFMGISPFRSWDGSIIGFPGRKVKKKQNGHAVLLSDCRKTFFLGSPFGGAVMRQHD
jgi:hypothetical protein